MPSFLISHVHTSDAPRASRPSSTIRRLCASMVGTCTIGLSVTIVPACSAQYEDSETKIVGGVEDNNIHPEAIGLFIESFDGSIGKCTGSIVRDDLVLTAAHCVVDKPTKSIVVSVSLSGGPDIVRSQGPTTSQFVTFPGYNSQIQAAGSLATDVAFVIYPKGTFAGRPMATLSSSSPKVGDPVRLVGYGRTDGADPQSNSNHQRHTGTSIVANVDPNFANAIWLETTQVSATSASAASGDSGGPLFNAAGQIVGIAQSASGKSNASISKDNPQLSGYVNINDPGVSEFIRTVMAADQPDKNTAQHVRSTPIDLSPPNKQ